MSIRFFAGAVSPRYWMWWIGVAASGSGCWTNDEAYLAQDSDLRDTEFQVVAMDPPVDSDIATPFSEIRLQFNRDVQAATVTGETVWMVERESLRKVPVAVALSPDPKYVVLTPASPLAPNSRYTVLVDGVAADTGEQAIFSGRLFTRFYYQCSYRQYQGSGVVRYFRSTFDRRTQTRIATFATPGPDGYPLTWDDVISNRSEYVFDAERDNTSALVRSSPGTDGQFGNDDDKVLFQRLLEHSDRGLEHLYYVYAGADNNLDTTDDYEADITLYYYDEQDRRDGSCFVDTGNDRTAFTDDDTTTSCAYAVASPNEESRNVTAVGPGADGQWRTEDDELATRWTRWAFDSGPVSPRFETHRLAEDGTATPGPTSLLAYDLYQINESGFVVGVRSFDGAGPDGIWFSNDDTATEKSDLAYDSNGFPHSRVTTTAGLDRALDTADDQVIHRYDWCPSRYYNEYREPLATSMSKSLDIRR